MFRRFVISLVAFFLILISARFAAALCISPGVIEVPYEPGKSHSFVFTASLCGSPPGWYTTFVEGELADHVTITEQRIYIQKSYQFVVDFVIPQLQKPGQHSFKIKVRELPQKVYGRPSGAYAVAAVIARVEVWIPYPDIYAKLDLKEVDKANVGDTIYFEAVLKSYGEKIIEKAHGYIDIFPVLSESPLPITTVPLTEVYGLLSMSRANMYAEWDTTGILPGLYRAYATVFYDGKNATDFVQFMVGSLDIEILDISPKKLLKDSITKLDVAIKNLWAQKIPIFCEFILKNGTATLAEAKTPTETIQPFSTGTISAYLDLNEVPAGTYQLEIVAHYAEKTESKTFDVEIVETLELPKPAKKPSYTYLTLLLISIALLIAIILYRRRRSQ